MWVWAEAGPGDILIPEREADVWTEWRVKPRGRGGDVKIRFSLSLRRLVCVDGLMELTASAWGKRAGPVAGERTLDILESVL